MNVTHDWAYQKRRNYDIFLQEKEVIFIALFHVDETTMLRRLFGTLASPACHPGIQEAATILFNIGKAKQFGTSARTNTTLLHKNPDKISHLHKQKM
jgi:hypothetical protein